MEPLTKESFDGFLKKMMETYFPKPPTVQPFQADFIKRAYGTFQVHDSVVIEPKTYSQGFVDTMRQQRHQQLLAYQLGLNRFLYGFDVAKVAWTPPAFNIGRRAVLRKAEIAEWVTETLVQFHVMSAHELEVANEVSKTGWPVQDVLTTAVQLGFGNVAEGFDLPLEHPRREW